MAKTKPKFPATVYVYEADGGTGPDFLCIASGLEEIPEDRDRETIATYKLTRVSTFKIGRVLE